MSTFYLQHLAQAFRRQHDCEAEHLETVSVIHHHEGRKVWEGKVEVFKLKGHPQADKGYAWAHDTDKDAEPVAILELPPIVSPKTAVQAVIVSRGK
jgi:hypothetical protein